LRKGWCRQGPAEECCRNGGYGGGCGWTRRRSRRIYGEQRKERQSEEISEVEVVVVDIES
jgi:hypothetical protein